MKQQTAVEWLIEKLESSLINTTGDYKVKLIIGLSDIEQARKMEKQQMIEFAEDSLDYLLDNREDLILLTTQDRIEHFYNETYGGTK